ncbi:MAG TPA: hypothetical protein VFF06_22020 [Polyangia bacterium]|nr:hypothetical protein [Polyangia bacterium]
MQPLSRAGLLVCCASVAGCFSVPNEFICQHDTECALAGVTTRCELSTGGHCSAQQTDCPSGYRYLDNAGPYAGLCVDSGDGGALDGPPAGDGPASLDGGGDGGGGSCPRPYLMIAVEDQTTPQANEIGRVLRFSLDAAGALHSCTTLDGSGSLGGLPQAVTFVPPRFVAVAARDATYVLDADSDQIQWSYPVPGIGGTTVAMDIVPLVEPTSGETRIAVGFSNGSPTIDQLYLYRDAVTTPTIWDVNSGLGLALSLGGITQQQPPTSNFWALNDGYQESIGDNPFTKVKTPYIPAFGGSDQITTIYELDVSGVRRTVWVDSTANGLFHADDSGGGAPTVLGPTKCTGGVTCTFRHAVPDPTTDGASFVLCAEPSSTFNDAKVERLTSTGACTVLYDGKSALDVDKRMTHLAVAMP